jgi:hypothetical protein
LNELSGTWIVASGLEDSAKTPPGYDRITIFAQAAQATDIEQAKSISWRPHGLIVHMRAR